MSAWWWACPACAGLLMQARGGAPPVPHCSGSSPVVISPAIAAALRERERMRGALEAVLLGLDFEKPKKWGTHERRMIEAALAPAAPKAHKKGGDASCPSAQSAVSGLQPQAIPAEACSSTEGPTPSAPAAPKAEVRCEGCEKQQEAYNYTDDVRLCDECWNALPTMRKPAARRKEKK